MTKIIRSFFLTFTLISALCSASLANPPATQQPMLLGSGCLPGTTTIFLTSGSTWTVDPCWNSANNSVELLSGGGGGDAGSGTFAGRGGGASAYAKSSNLVLTPGASINIGVGLGGAPAACGTDSWFNATSLANAISNGPTVSVGAQHGCNVAVPGLASASVGSTKFDGGAGAAGGASAPGGGAGGAAGPSGAGGAASTSTGGTGNGGTVPANTSGTIWTQTSNGAVAGPGGGRSGITGIGPNGMPYGAAAAGGYYTGSIGGTGAPGIIVVKFTN